MTRAAPILVALIAVSGCRDQSRSLRVGAKGFAEQEILAHAVSALLVDGGLRAHVRPCENTFSCMGMLRSGGIDVMVDYTGTALQFAGGPRADRARPLAQLNALYGPVGIRWLALLGFTNSYRIFVAPGGSTARAIGDLAKLEGGVRLACPSEYRRRPGDGLAALVERHGFELAGEPLIIEDPLERYRALVDGRVDVAVGYGTDGALEDVELVELADSLQFYPPYQAALVVADSTLRRHPEIAEILAVLGGRIDRDHMRAANHEVAVRGGSPALAAARLLERLELAKVTEAVDGSVVRIAASSAAFAFEAPARQTARGAFDNAAVDIVESDDPARAVAQGEARLAAVAAWELFDAPGEPTDRLEAAAVIGKHTTFLVRRTGDPAGGLDGRVGVADGDVLGARVLRALDRTADQTGTAAGLLSKLVAGQVDGVLLPSVPGPGPGYELRSLQPPTAPDGSGLPWLRPSRLPARAVPGRLKPLETLVSQVVLAGAARRVVGGAGGPAAAPQRTTPLVHDDVVALADASPIAEAPSPTLPSYWSARGTLSIGPSDAIWDTVLNLLVLLFLLGWVRAVIRR